MSSHTPNYALDFNPNIHPHSFFTRVCKTFKPESLQIQLFFSKKTSTPDCFEPSYKITLIKIVTAWILNDCFKRWQNINARWNIHTAYGPKFSKWQTIIIGNWKKGFINLLPFCSFTLLPSYYWKVFRQRLSLIHSITFIKFTCPVKRSHLIITQQAKWPALLISASSGITWAWKKVLFHI